MVITKASMPYIFQPDQAIASIEGFKTRQLKPHLVTVFCFQNKKHIFLKTIDKKFKTQHFIENFSHILIGIF
jgi:hypothetical protein